MRRKVTKHTREKAFASIKTVAKAMLAGETVISYSDLAVRIGTNPTGQGLGDILDEAARMCIDHRLPDVSAVVCTKDSIDEGRPMPSSRSFVDGVWPITGISIDEVPAEQERVRIFPWLEVRSLGLAREMKE